MSPLLKNLLIALGIVIAVGVVYFLLAGDAPEEGGDVLIESDAVRQTARILSDTQKIDEFNVTGDLLQSQVFKSLKENNIDSILVDPGTGRPNPFEEVL